MKPFKTQAHIHSLNGEMDEITVLEETGNNEYLVDYRGVKCSAIFNWYNCTYYADDVYGRKRIEDDLLLLQQVRRACIPIQRRKRRTYRTMLYVLFLPQCSAKIPQRVWIATKAYPVGRFI